MLCDETIKSSVRTVHIYPTVFITVHILTLTALLRALTGMSPVPSLEMPKKVISVPPSELALTLETITHLI